MAIRAPRRRPSATSRRRGRPMRSSATRRHPRPRRRHRARAARRRWCCAGGDRGRGRERPRGRVGGGPAEGRGARPAGRGGGTCGARPPVAASWPACRRRRRGDLGERRQRGLVAAGVERERRLVVGDRERLGGDDLAGVDVGGHQVPRDGVLVLAGEQRPRRDVEPGVAGQRAVVEVDRRRDLLEHGVGEHAQVGDAEQDVGRVGVEAGERARRPGRRRRCPRRWRSPGRWRWWWR